MGGNAVRTESELFRRGKTLKHISGDSTAILWAGELGRPSIGGEMVSNARSGGRKEVKGRDLRVETEPSQG